MSVIKLSDAKRAYAQKALAAAKAKGLVGTVIVLPEFMEENGQWVPTETAVVESPNSSKGFGYVGLIQNRTVFAKGVEFDNDLWAIQRGKIASLGAKYTPGMTLPGHIVVEDTLTAPNSGNLQQDLKYISASARLAGIACTIDDQPIYQVKYWDPSGTSADITIHHNNDVPALVAASASVRNEQLQAKRTQLTMLLGKTTKTAGDKKLIADLQLELS